MGWALASILGFNVTPEPALPERDDGEGHSAHVPMLMKSRTERTRRVATWQRLAQQPVTSKRDTLQVSNLVD